MRFYSGNPAPRLENWHSGGSNVHIQCSISPRSPSTAGLPLSPTYNSVSPSQCQLRRKFSKFEKRNCYLFYCYTKGLVSFFQYLYVENVFMFLLLSIIKIYDIVRPKNIKSNSSPTLSIVYKNFWFYWFNFG